nr:hypothetical protein [Clostridium botulinum]
MPREFVEYTNDLPIKVSMQNIKKKSYSLAQCYGNYICFRR